LGDIEQQKILQTKYQERLDFANSYFSSVMGYKSLVNRDITYVYLPKIYGVNLDNRTELTKIFENKEALIYQVQKNNLRQ